MVRLPFKNRKSAGNLLAQALSAYRDRQDLVVLALPRGGVPVGAKVAEAMDAPLDVMIVRKLGTPGQEELAMGAIASGGIRVLNEELVTFAGIDQETIDEVSTLEQKELERQEKIYRGGRARVDLEGQTVLLVDDGLATGTTMRAAVQATRAEGAAVIVVAIPVAPPDTIEQLYNIADDVVCLQSPEPFGGVGLWYLDFRQTTDQEVIDLLYSARTRSYKSNIEEE